MGDEKNDEIDEEIDEIDGASISSMTVKTLKEKINREFSLPYSSIPRLKEDIKRKLVDLIKEQRQQRQQQRQGEEGEEGEEVEEEEERRRRSEENGQTMAALKTSERELDLEQEIEQQYHEEEEEEEEEEQQQQQQQEMRRR